ncbi:MAG: amidohydrolase family protein [Spirochaetales bacterium]|nr:amidohydrolase family protein [Spirochaetales bacterium]
MLDLSIENGLIVDGSGSDAFQADIGICDGRIVNIGRNLPEARKHIDAKGRIVTPGFIDMHAHSELVLLNDPSSKGRIAQGITTDVSGNCGIGVFPVAGNLEALKALDDDVLGKWPDWNWKDIVGFREYVEKHGPGHNAVFLQAHAPLRIAVMGRDASRAATDSEIERMCALLDFSLSNGARGLSSGLYYAPCIFADRRELVELLKVVKRHDAFFAVHHRCEGNTVVESVREVLCLAEETGARLEISHLKAVGMDNQDKVDQVLSLIDIYRNRGVDVLFDQYPYTFGSTSLFSLLPPAALKLDRESLRTALMDDGTRRMWREEILNARDWDSIYSLSGERNVVAVQLDSSPDLQGLSLYEIGRRMGCDGIDALFNVLSVERGAAVMTDVTQSEESLVKIMSSPLMCFGTDALYSADVPHPRSYSAAIHLLESYVLKRKVLRLEDAVRRMSSEVASRLRLSGRGLLRSFQAADICIIDPESLHAGAAAGRHFDRNPGLDYVILNGQIALERGYVTGKGRGVIL